MTCENCGSDRAQGRRIPRTYGEGADLLVIENVPVVTCPQCGISYLTADILHEVERIKQHRKSLAAARSVEVAILR